MQVSRALVCLLALVAAAPVAVAQAPVDLAPALPADTPVYVRTAGLEALLNEIAASRMLRNGAALRKVYDEQIATLWPLLEDATEVKAADWAKMVKGVKSAHLALFAMGRRETDNDFIVAAEVADPGLVRTTIAKLLARFGRTEEFAGEVAGARVMAIALSDEIDLYYAIRGNLVVGTFSPERISTLLEGLANPPDKSLATSPAYRAGALKASGSDVLFAFADGPSFLTMMQGTMSRRDIQDFEEVDQVLGMREAQSLSVVSGGGQTRARLIYPPDHKWMAAFRGEPGPSGLLPFMPATTFFGMVDSGSIAKKWSGIRKLLTDEQSFPFAKDVKQGLGEAEKMLGMSFDEIAEALGSEWCFFIPLLDGTLNRADDNLTFAAEIEDREKFDAVLAKFMKSEVMKEMTKSLGAPVVQSYGGFEITGAAESEERRATPCMAIGENVLLFSGSVKAVKAAIDAKTKGTGMLSSARPFLAGLPGSSSKFASMDMNILLTFEREFTPLLDLVREGAMIAATTDEAAGRMDMMANASLPGFIGILVAGELLEERYRAERAECLSNLNAVGEAIKKYKAKHEGQSPPNLLSLVPDFLPKERLVCPFDKGTEGVKCSYHDALGKGDDESGWYINAWCPHRLHGRLVLQRDGRSWRSSESSLHRRSEQQGFELK